MARMIPELSSEQLRNFRSRAEARFYEACEDQLPDDVVVIHSAGWIYRDQHGRFREGEADFTLLFPQSGIIVVEVKGGGVVFNAQSGEWFSVDRNGQRHRIKDPFRQATGERHALLDQIAGHPAWRQWRGRRLNVGHAVVFPDIDDSASLQGPDRPRDIIAVNRDLRTLSAWIDRVTRFWRRHDDDPLGVQGARLVEDVLCRSIEVKPVLRSTVDDAEKLRVRLTANQAKVLRTIGGRKRAVVSGGAGTGKTLLAVEKARQFAQSGLTVLLLCYNRPLADALAVGLRDEPRVLCLSFHQLCDRRVRQVLQACGRNLLEEAAIAYAGYGDKHIFEVQMPYALALSNELLAEKFDAIVVDEAQDFSDEYWFSVEELLKNQEAGYLYIFIDENQKLYRRHGSLPVDDDPHYLFVNCRNTATIHEVGYAFYSGEPVDPPDLRGPAVERIAIDQDELQADAVVRKMCEWVQIEGILASDVVVLVAKKPKAHAYDLLQRRSQAAKLVWAVEAHGQQRGVLLDTVARFKGLEAQAVVLWVGDEIVDEQQWETVYVGATRAKSILCIVSSVKTMKGLR